MNDRTLIAAMAMQGILANPAITDKDKAFTVLSHVDAVEFFAYKQADAMLKESSNCESKETPKRKRKEYTADFEEFWTTWEGSRKSNKWATFQIWQRQKPDFEQVLIHLRAAMETRDWVRGFDPLPTSYMNKRMYLDVPPEPWDGTEDGKIINTERYDKVHNV